MGGTAWVARPDSRSQDLEGRASWVGLQQQASQQ